MAKRPNIFSQSEFENSLRRQGCSESFIKPITSDFRLFVPVVLRHLGEEKLFDILKNSRTELKLGEQDPAWHEAVKYIVGWAEEQINGYIAQK